MPCRPPLPVCPPPSSSTRRSLLLAACVAPRRSHHRLHARAGLLRSIARPCREPLASAAPSPPAVKSGRGGVRSSPGGPDTAAGDARDMTPSRAAARPAPRASPPPRAEMGHSRGGCGPAATIPACRAVSGGGGGGTRVSPPGHPRVDDAGGGGEVRSYIYMFY